MSIKELIIELRVPLPGEMYEVAEKIVAVKAVSDNIEAEAKSAFGEDGYTLTVDIGTKRAPRADAGRPRKARGNGAETSEPYTVPAT